MLNKEVEFRSTYIYHREDIEIIFVNKALNLRIRSVVGEQVESHVFGDHGGNPFSSMDGSVEYNGRLGALSTTPVKMDSSNRSTLTGVSCNDNLRSCRIRGLEIPEELKMVGISVIRIKPG